MNANEQEEVVDAGDVDSAATMQGEIRFSSDGDNTEPSPKQVKLELIELPQELSTSSKLLIIFANVIGFLRSPENKYTGFNVIKADSFEKLPKLFRNGIETSDLWKQQRTTEVSQIANCMSLYVPCERRDGYLLIRGSFDWMWELLNMFGYGEVENKS